MDESPQMNSAKWMLLLAVCFVTLATTGCEYHREQSSPDVVLITAYGDTVSPGIQLPEEQSDSKWSVGFPPKDWKTQGGSAFNKTIDGIEFIGQTMKGDDEFVTVLAARLPNTHELKVIIDSTRPLIVRGKIMDPDGSTGEPELYVEPGKHELVLDCSPTH